MRDRSHNTKTRIRDKASAAWTSLTLLSTLGVLAGLMFANSDGGGTGDGAAGSGEGGTATPPAAPPAPAADTVSKAEAERQATAAANAAKKAAEQQVADTLGVSVAEAKKLIDAQKATEDAAKSDTQKALEAATAAQAAAELAKSEAAADRLAAKVERKLGAAGVDDKALARAIRLVALDPDADDAAIDAEIEALKTDVPGLFAKVEAPELDANGQPVVKAPPAPGKPAVKPPAGGTSTVTGIAAGREKARAARPEPKAEGKPFAKLTA